MTMLTVAISPGVKISPPFQMAAVNCQNFTREIATFTVHKCAEQVPQKVCSNSSCEL